MVYYEISLIFLMLPFIRYGYDFIVLTNLITVIWDMMLL